MRVTYEHQSHYTGSKAGYFLALPAAKIIDTSRHVELIKIRRNTKWVNN